MAIWTDDLDQLDAMRFARSLERDCQEAVKWEIRKLEWLKQELETKHPEGALATAA